MTKLEFWIQKSAGWAMPKKAKTKPQKRQKPKSTNLLGGEDMEERYGRNYIFHIGRATHYIYLLDFEKDLFEQYYGVVLQPV